MQPGCIGAHALLIRGCVEPELNEVLVRWLYELEYFVQYQVLHTLGVLRAIVRTQRVVVDGFPVPVNECN
jgi:hypothetical protein